MASSIAGEGSPTKAVAPPAKRARISSIDMLRGLVIVIMALDHVRDYTSGFRGDLLNPDQTTTLLYATRWITHFCAPTFVFLAGVSAGFQQQAGKSTGVLSRFLLTRGLWLILLELTVVRMGWFFDFTPALFLQVIWAIGVSMICLAGFVFLPRWTIFAVGVAMVLGHNLLDGMGPFSFNPNAPSSLAAPSTVLWAFLHNGGFYRVGPFLVFIAYPLIPWVGVMALGYLFADFYRTGEKKRRETLIKIGLALFAAFILLRAFNVYGDPLHWSAQPSAVKSMMSFLNVQKYPPSLLYLCATLGPAIFLLAFAERWKGPIVGFFLTFGRVPLFFYVLHIYLAHLAAVLLGVAQGYPAGAMMRFAFFFPQKYGVGLAGVYAIWIAVVAALYFPCRWFGTVKRRSNAWWMSYV